MSHTSESQFANAAVYIVAYAAHLSLSLVSNAFNVSYISATFSSSQHLISTTKTSRCDDFDLFP